MAELKPCPFCGKDAQIAPDEIGSGGQHVPPYHAGCLRGAGCGIAFTADDPDEAIAEWNRRALAERAGGVKGEWHRADGDKSILLYTLRQDGWRKGEAVMVNDVTVRIEAANGSESPIEPIASAILSALTTEPATPEGRQEPIGYIDPADIGRKSSVGELLIHWCCPEMRGRYTQPLYTHPSEQAVTEAMVEAAREIIHGARHVYSDEDLARAALKAAMEAGHD